MPGRSLIKGLPEKSRIVLQFLDKDTGEQFAEVSLPLTAKPTSLKTEY